LAHLHLGDALEVVSGLGVLLEEDERVGGAQERRDVVRVRRQHLHERQQVTSPSTEKGSC